MSQSLKIALWAIVAVAVIGGAWWYVSRQQTVQVPAPASSSNAPQQGGASQTSGGPAGLLVGNSDAALNQDLSSLDAQLSGLATDSASVEQGLSDQPILQGE